MQRAAARSSGPSSVAADDEHREGAMAPHDALTMRIELARSMQPVIVLRPLCDSLDAHPVEALGALAALVHSPVDASAPADTLARSGESERRKDLCQAGHGLCCALMSAYLRAHSTPSYSFTHLPTTHSQVRTCRNEGVCRKMYEGISHTGTSIGTSVATKWHSAIV